MLKGKGKKGAAATNPGDDLADQLTNQQAQRPVQIQLPGTRGVGGGKRRAGLRLECKANERRMR